MEILPILPFVALSSLKYPKEAISQFPGAGGGGRGKDLSRPILRALSVKEEQSDFLDSDKYKFLLLRLLLCPSCGDMQRHEGGCFVG